jgi:hypothetical protein
MWTKTARVFVLAAIVCRIQSHSQPTRHPCHPSPGDCPRIPRAGTASRGDCPQVAGGPCLTLAGGGRQRCCLAKGVREKPRVSLFCLAVNGHGNKTLAAPPRGRRIGIEGQQRRFARTNPIASYFYAPGDLREITTNARSTAPQPQTRTVQRRGGSGHDGEVLLLSSVV